MVTKSPLNRAPADFNLWEEEETQPLHLLQGNLIMDCRFRRSVSGLGRLVYLSDYLSKQAHASAWVCFFVYNPTKFYNNDQVSISAQKKESGELSILIREYGLPSYYPQWMAYYEFYCEHSTMSYTELSCYFHVTRSTIYRAVQFMKSSHPETVPKLRNA